MDLINLELILKMCVALGAVLLLFGGLAFLFKKLNGSKWFGSALKGKSKASLVEFDVVDTKALAPGKTLHVIQVGSKRILVAATQQNVNFLTDIEDEAFSPEQSFKDVLKQSTPGQRSESFKDSLSKGILGIPRV